MEKVHTIIEHYFCPNYLASFKLNYIWMNKTNLLIKTIKYTTNDFLENKNIWLILFLTYRFINLLLWNLSCSALESYKTTNEYRNVAIIMMRMIQMCIQIYAQQRKLVCLSHLSWCTIKSKKEILIKERFLWPIIMS